MSNKKVKPGKNYKSIYIGAAVLIILAVIIVVFAIPKGETATESAASAQAIDGIKIPKSEVTAQAKFYPYTVDNVKMEVMAVKANDGTIRTAFNTCQVCYASGRGYYKQIGSDLECQNCGNRFRIEQIEKVKNGCNPVPIMKQDKTDDGTNIVISKDFLAQYKNLFLNWKK